MSLVSSSDFEKLPLEPVSRWLKLRDLLEQRLANVTDERQGVSDEDLVEYCTVLVSAAEELKLKEFSDYSVGDIRQHFTQLRSEIIALATTLSIRSVTKNAAYSVGLPRTSKAKLFSQIEKLRSVVGNSDLPEKQKKQLSKKLDELQSIVVAPRTDYARLMAIVSYLALGLGGTTSFLADAPDALATIAAVIGEAKEAEEEELRMVEAEEAPLKLEDLRGSEGNGEDIPF